ncbi:MAG: hypothetical protein ABL907_03505, partial [Hyphomicrobium sp.]
LDPTQDTHIFAVLPERDDCSVKPRHYRGTFEDLLPRLLYRQRQGCGVFVTVNAMQGARRRACDVARIRALWAERDAPGSPLPLPPSLVIATSPGRCHEYLLTDDTPPDPEEAHRLNRRLAAQCDSDRAATDPARLLRLAGSWNLKAAPFAVHITQATGQRYDVDALRAALPEPDSVGPSAAPHLRTPSFGLPPHIHALDRYLDVVVRAVTDELACAPVGTRNTTLNRAAFRLARLGVAEDDISACLAPTAQAIGLAAPEIAATIRSAARGALR